MLHQKSGCQKSPKSVQMDFRILSNTEENNLSKAVIYKALET